MVEVTAIEASGGVALGELLAEVQTRLRIAGIEDAGREARRLIGALTSTSPETFLIHPERLLTTADRSRVLDGLAKRVAGMPIGRIAGTRDFYGRAFRLGPAILEPRPDSEVLVDAALEVIAEAGQLLSPIKIIDVGTGSGCLLITLLAELPHAVGTGVDISAEALAVAKDNAWRHGVGERATFVQGDALKGIDEAFDVLVSNPPYLRTEELAGLQREVRDHDPVLALDGGADGLDIYRRIGRDAARVVPDGWMLFEVGAGMSTDVCHEIDQFSVDNHSCRWRVWQDLNDHVRCVAAKTLNRAGH